MSVRLSLSLRYSPLQRVTAYSDRPQAAGADVRSDSDSGRTGLIMANERSIVARTPPLALPPRDYLWETAARFPSYARWPIDVEGVPVRSRVGVGWMSRWLRGLSRTASMSTSMYVDWHTSLLQLFDQPRSACVAVATERACAPVGAARARDLPNIASASTPGSPRAVDPPHLTSLPILEVRRSPAKHGTYVPFGRRSPMRDARPPRPIARDVMAIVRCAAASQEAQASSESPSEPSNPRSVLRHGAERLV